MFAPLKTRFERNRPVLLVVVSLLAACGKEEAKSAQVFAEEDVAAPAAAEAKSEKRNPLEVYLQSVEAFNTANAAKMRDSMTREAASWAPCGIRGPVRGIRDIMRTLTALKGLVPDVRLLVRRVMRRDDIVIAQTVTTGTKKWNERGAEETPKRVGFEGVAIVLSDENGRARETLQYFDQAVMMRQVGSLSGEARPLPEPPKDRPEIIDAAETDGAVELAIAALTSFGGKCERLSEMVSPGFSYTDTTTGRTLDLASLPAFLASQRLTENGLVYTVQQSIGAGPYAVIRWEAAGRFAGKGNVGPTDIVLHGVHIFRIESGRIVSVEAYGSDFEYLQKTGLIAEAVASDEEDALGPRGTVKGTSKDEGAGEIGAQAKSPAKP